MVVIIEIVSGITAGSPMVGTPIPGGSTFLSCSFAISEVFGHNGMI